MRKVVVVSQENFGKHCKFFVHSLCRHDLEHDRFIHDLAQFPCRWQNLTERCTTRCNFSHGEIESEEDRDQFLPREASMIKTLLQKHRLDLEKKKWLKDAIERVDASLLLVQQQTESAQSAQTAADVEHENRGDTEGSAEAQAGGGYVGSPVTGPAPPGVTINTGVYGYARMINPGGFTFPPPSFPAYTYMPAPGSDMMSSGSLPIPFFAPPGAGNTGGGTSNQ
uniref:C3H1-type domain-containing protein n=1 Tax=Chromera velia CCMP2878 TaxID=1169474 RepID=A0A0G4HXS4_9ALVE|eukprot:Cvel_9329.t1-p1 / transcript=Cvel_9329.t1 / gene=Cvel_9329 / organism=Chromera_velia_CCMP2878 / gene_product=hypothetical protein / transcript_product=hypothetical protein / location=Cvel_scaffold535:32316-34772(+) / protein_length=223 / sequence_SO=supercontig / SO=protein_coding / is_pseudo=false